MARETKAQKDARVGALLAEYDEKSRALRKLEADVKDMKDRIRELPTGQYGEWIFGYGTPREIMDQKQVQKDYADQGKDVPKMTTAAPLVITHAAATGK